MHIAYAYTENDFNKRSTIEIQWQIVRTKRPGLMVVDYGVDFDVYLVPEFAIEKKKQPGAKTQQKYFVLDIWDVLIQLNWTRITILKLNLEIILRWALITIHCGLIFHLKFELLPIFIFFFFLGIGLTMNVVSNNRTPTKNDQIKYWLKFNLPHLKNDKWKEKVFPFLPDTFSIILFINLWESLIWQ